MPDRTRCPTRRRTYKRSPCLGYSARSTCKE